MNAERSLFTFEIGEPLVLFTRKWVERARLSSFLQVEHRSSLDPASPGLAREFLRGAPELVFIDSSHQYGHTVSELELWYPEIAPGGMVVLHDSSKFAEGFDVTGKGGVARALREWRETHPGVETISLNHDVRAMETPEMVYQDFCGIGLIQKPFSREPNE